MGLHLRTSFCSVLMRGDGMYGGLLTMPPRDPCRCCRGSPHDPWRTSTIAPTSRRLAFSSVYAAAAGLMSQAYTVGAAPCGKRSAVRDRSLARAHARAPAQFSDVTG